MERAITQQPVYTGWDTVVSSAGDRRNTVHDEHRMSRVLIIGGSPTQKRALLIVLIQ